MNRRRWLVCGLLFAATGINYIDRQMIGVLKPVLQAEFGWSEIDYGDIVFWFQAAYAIGYVSFGHIIDRVGVRLGYAGAVLLWTAAHMAHAAAHTLNGFTIARFALGLGESGNFPAGLKAVGEWFEARERALAIGIFNAGANIGAIVTPLIVPAITLSMGWPAAFLITGLFSIAWLAAWLIFYRSPPNVAQEKLEAPPWRVLLRTRETWAYAAGKFLIDPIWWMFLFWLPDFFAKRHGLDLKSYGPPLVAVYVISDLGSIFGGYLSSALIARGFTVGGARKTAMLLCSFAVLPVTCAAFIDDLWTAIAVVGLATAAHQGFSANLYALPSDLFPRNAVASVAGIGGTAGALGGMLMAKYAGYVLDVVGTYTPIFMLAGLTYFLALLSVHGLARGYRASQPPSTAMSAP